MTLNKREQGLLAVTAVLAVAGVSYLLLMPLWRQWQGLQGRITTQQRELAGMREYVNRVPQWQQEFAELRAGLGQSQQQFAQTSDVLKKIEEVGATAGILIQARRPLPPVDKGVYRELPVQCSFEADTESLVKFLYGLQSSSGFVSVEQLQVYPRADGAGLLRCDIQIRALAGKTEGGS